MADFSIEKKGYKRAEVDAYLAERERAARKVQDDQLDRIRALRAEADEWKQKAESLAKRERMISDSLVAAVAKAQEIETAARRKYEQELAGLREFHAKWMKYYERILEKYPLDETLNRAGTFNRSMSKILDGAARASESCVEKKAARREPSADPAEAQFSDETRRLEGGKGINMSAVSSALEDAVREDERFDRVAASWARSVEPPEPVKAYLDAIDPRTGVNPSALQTPGTNGFSFQEALHPTDDLEDIMSEFGLGGALEKK